MIETIFIILTLLLGLYTIITIILLMAIAIEDLPLDDGKYGAFKFFGWPIYFPYWLIKSLLKCLYCKMLIKLLDKLKNVIMHKN